MRIKDAAIRFLAFLLVVIVSVAFVPALAGAAGVTVYKDGDKYVKIGGRVQIQYHGEDPDTGGYTDSLFFRRLRPYVEGSLYKDWSGKLQWDMGKAAGENEIAVKEAYVRYLGFKDATVTFGNLDFPFSREKLTSSKKQNLVERTFVGTHDYGTPDKQLGIHVRGHNPDKSVTYGVSAASASMDPDSAKLDFDTPVNKSADFNEGWIFGGRVDYHPFGYMKFDQGDFKRDGLKATIGAAVFVWSNDGDNDTYTTGSSDTSSGATPDVDSVKGYEISGGVRYMGLSVDAQYNLFDAETIDSSVTAGIYRNGTTELTNYALEGGYMVMPDKLELVAGYQVQDADNYATEWTRTSVGANYFIKKHDIKAQLTYRMGSDLSGVSGSDKDEIFIQTQYVF